MEVVPWLFKVSIWKQHMTFAYHIGLIELQRRLGSVEEHMKLLRLVASAQGSNIGLS